MTDMTLKEAVTLLQNQGRAFRAVMVLADEIDKVGKISQLTGEANVALTKAQSDKAEIDKAVIEAAAELKTAQAKTKEAKGKAEKLVSDAEAKAKARESEAGVTAENIIAIAKEEAKSIKDAATKSKVAADTAVRDKQAELAGLDEKISKSAAELVEVEAKIEKARETVKKMMGG